MANDVVLSASMRSNLLSLQNTQRSIDMTQLRLATGKKVNSALDNPQSFFTSQSLSNRAGDLSRLLDGIGQAIRTIEEADKGVTALTSLVTQAESIVNSARDELAASDGEARAVGNVNLNNVSDITTGAFSTAGIGNNDQFRIITTNDAGNQITQTITIATGDTAASLTARITDAFADNLDGEISAKVTADGYISIESKDGRTFKVLDSVATGTQVTLAGFTALGLGRYFELEQRGATGAQIASSTIIAGNTARSISLYEATGDLADAGDSIQGQVYTDANGNVVSTGLAITDSITFQINNGAATPALTLTAATTWQDLVDQVNQNTNFNQLIELGFDKLSGQLTVTSLSDTVENVSMNFVSAGAVPTKVFNIGLGGQIDYTATTAAGTYETVLSFNTSTAGLDRYAADFNTIRGQIDDLVKDAQYRGVNLLRGDDLVTFFNEDNSSSLTTAGTTFTAEGLGLVVANFRSSEQVENMADLVKSALNEVRNFGSTLANNLSIIQTRRTFTEETIVTLKAGSADLVNADDNEEGANLLALQTRQQLGVTSLSLASQSQQSVLRLF